MEELLDYNFVKIKKNGKNDIAFLILDFVVDDVNNVLVYIDKKNIDVDNLIIEYAYYELNDDIYELSDKSVVERNLINNAVLSLIDEMKKNINNVNV